jgi:hypothetical protein
LGDIFADSREIFNLLDFFSFFNAEGAENAEVTGEGISGSQGILILQIYIPLRNTGRQDLVKYI